MIRMVRMNGFADHVYVDSDIQLPLFMNNIVALVNAGCFAIASCVSSIVIIFLDVILYYEG